MPTMPQTTVMTANWRTTLSLYVPWTVDTFQSSYGWRASSAASASGALIRIKAPNRVNGLSLEIGELRPGPVPPGSAHGRTAVSFSPETYEPLRMSIYALLAVFALLSEAVIWPSLLLGHAG